MVQHAVCDEQEITSYAPSPLNGGQGEMCALLSLRAPRGIPRARPSPSELKVRLVALKMQAATQMSFKCRQMAIKLQYILSSHTHTASLRTGYRVIKTISQK